MIGQSLAHYRITAAIGEGGMGEVYRATDTRLGREGALKVLPAAMAASPDRLARFQREARAVAALNHPHIVTIYSVEQAGGVHFLTMELAEGQGPRQRRDGSQCPSCPASTIASHAVRSQTADDPTGSRCRRAKAARRTTRPR